MARTLKLFLTTFVTLAMIVLIPACNTVRGLGKDIEATGAAGQELIDDAGK